LTLRFADSGGSNGARERTYGFFVRVVWYQKRSCSCIVEDGSKETQSKVRFINPKPGDPVRQSCPSVCIRVRQLLSSILSFFWASRGAESCQSPGRQPSHSDRPIVVQCCTPSLDPLVTIRCLWPKERVAAPPQAERTAHRSSSSSPSRLSSSSSSSLILSLSFDELLGLTPNAVTYHRFIGSLESGTNVLTTH